MSESRRDGFGVAAGCEEFGPGPIDRLVETTLSPVVENAADALNEVAAPALETCPGARERPFQFLDLPPTGTECPVTNRVLFV